MPHAGKDATIKASGTPTAMSNESCTELTATTFQITDATRRILDPAATFVVRVNTVIQDPATYSIDHLFGIITFDSSQTGQPVDITGDFLPVHDLAEVRSVSLSVGRDQEDSTTIGDDAHKMTALLQTASATFESLDDLRTDLDPGGGTLELATVLRDGTPKLFELNLDGSNGYRVWMKAENADFSAAPDSLATSSLGLVADLQNGADNVWGYGAF